MCRYCFSADSNLSGPQSDWVSTLFDVGGIIGVYVSLCVYIGGLGGGGG